jgi:hypothetical protein
MPLQYFLYLRMVGSTVGQGTVLQAGGLLVRFPIESLRFFSLTLFLWLHYGSGFD